MVQEPLDPKRDAVMVFGNYAADAVGKCATYPSSIHLEIRVQIDGKLLTVEAGPYGYTVMNGLQLTSQLNTPHSAPVFAMELDLPRGMSPQKFKDNLLDGVAKYQNNAPYNFPLLGVGKMLWGYNSNSYVSGMIQHATGRYDIQVENEARRRGFIMPGFDKPAPIGLSK